MPKVVFCRSEKRNPQNISLVANGGIVTLADIVRLLVKRRGVFRLLVESTTLVFLGEKFLDFPVVLFDAD